MPKSLSESGKIIPTVECLIVKDGKVLLLKRSETSKNFPGYWIGPGGHVDQGEDVLTAAVREVFEETGIKINEEKINLKAIAIGNHIDRSEIYMVYYFLITLNSKQEIVSSDEGDSSWVSLDEIQKKENIFPPLKYYLEHALDPNSGILYTNVELKNLEIINVLSRRTDIDY
jgi:8-oxo-dGTP diphosphatase